MTKHEYISHRQGNPQLNARRIHLKKFKEKKMQKFFFVFLFENQQQQSLFHLTLEPTESTKSDAKEFFLCFSFYARSRFKRFMEHRRVYIRQFTLANRAYFVRKLIDVQL